MVQKLFLSIFLITLFGISCSTESKKSDKEAANSMEKTTTNENIPEEVKLSPIKLVEQAHKKSAVIENNAVAFDIILNFGGNEVLNGTMTLAGNSSKGLIQLKDGSEILHLGDKVYYSDSEKNPKSMRFAAYTWSYFFLFPYKLSDPGTNWGDLEQRDLAGKTFDFQKLTFDAGTGDAPDDWYLMYSDQENHLIEYAAYIVTAGSSQSEAEEDPHAIQYLDYKEINGVPFAHSWIFWEWREQEGLTKELGNAQLSNFRFVGKADDLFSIKEGYLMAE